MIKKLVLKAVLVVKFHCTITLVVVTDSLLGLCFFFDLLFAFDDSFVFTTVIIGIVTALKEFLKPNDVVFNNLVLLRIFDLMSLWLGKEHLFT